jgi:DNA-directed RNA polymerase specialized sigma24 family protein
MRDRTRKITLGGQEYTAIFTTYALAEVIDTYGGIEEMRKEMRKSRAAATKISAWLIALVVNQGIDYERHYRGIDQPYIKPEDVQFAPVPEFTRAEIIAFEALTEAFDTEGVEEEPDDEEDEVLAEIKKPNAAAKKQK